MEGFSLVRHRIGVHGVFLRGLADRVATGPFLVTAVCNAVRNRRGPAGLGMIMTSGSGAIEPAWEAITDCITSLIIL